MSNTNDTTWSMSDRVLMTIFSMSHDYNGDETPVSIDDVLLSCGGSARVVANSQRRREARGAIYGLVSRGLVTDVGGELLLTSKGDAVARSIPGETCPPAYYQGS